MTNGPSHPCRWPECERPVPFGVWGCLDHWFALPQDLRTQLFNADTNEKKIAAARAVQEWIASTVTAQDELPL